MKFTNVSLKTKIIGIVMTVVALIGLGSFFNMNQFASSYKETLNNKFESTAVALGESITAQLYERYGDVQAFALNPTIIQLDKHKLAPLLDQYVRMYGIYDLILVLDKSGNLVGSNTKDAAGKNVDTTHLLKVDFAQQPWFMAALKGESTEEKKNGYSGTYLEDFIDDPIMANAFGEPRFGTSFSTPIKNEEGKTVGVITNRAGKRWFENEVIKTYEHLHSDGFKDLEVTVTNREGKIISFAGTNEKTLKMEMVEDSKVILNENFVQNHVPGGEEYHKNKTGVARSKYITDDSFDIVGFHQIDNNKAIESLGWGAFVHDSEDDAYSHVKSAQSNFMFILGASLFIAIAIAVFFGVSIAKSITAVSTALAKNSSEVSSASVRIASGATELSESSTEQAAALQETVTAVDEISAMVDKNAEAANRSKDVSQQSKLAAERGREIMDQMLAAIDAIDHSNDEISKQMEESNRELSEITKMINDIGNKTKVINEIVFQTKLLSFNASVEAARAGEYGKGFSVVAEEVGNLAQMSGNAAKEISGLLDASVHKVNSIVNDTKSRVQRLTSNSKDKVKSGAQTAKECTDALEEILQNIQSVDSMVSEIAVASSEQSTGIQEISKAVGQMEQVTQQNSTVAQGSSVSAEQLRAQATHLNSIVQDLIFLIHGDRTNNTHHPKDLASEKASPSAGTSSKKGKDPKVAQNFGIPEKNVLPFQASEAPARDFHGDIKADFRPKQAAGGEFVPSSEDPGFSE